MADSSSANTLEYASRSGAPSRCGLRDQGVNLGRALQAGPGRLGGLSFFGIEPAMPVRKPDEVSPGARSAFLAWDVAAFSPRENAGLLQ